MRVVVTGATGNVGTSTLECLATDEQVTEIVGLARRKPALTFPKTRFISADVASSDLQHIFAGAHSVIHLAWLLQPVRDEDKLWRVNVRGTQRVLDAAFRAKVPHLAIASSVGAYAPGPKDRRVREDWPTTGIATSLYSRQKVAIERALDEFEHRYNKMRIARLRPGLIFKRQAGSGMKRLFLGSRMPQAVLRSRFARVVPDTTDLCFQAVHSLDVGDAFRRAAMQQASGAFNIAAEPVLDPVRIATALDATRVATPPRVLRAGVALTYHLRMHRTHPGWLDLAMQVPLMSTLRATEKLGWSPKYSASLALRELFRGMLSSDGTGTAPLRPDNEQP